MFALHDLGFIGQEGVQDVQICFYFTISAQHFRDG